MLTIVRKHNNKGESEGIDWKNEYEILLKALHDILASCVTDSKFNVIDALQGILYEDFSWQRGESLSLDDWRYIIIKETEQKTKKRMLESLSDAGMLP